MGRLRYKRKSAEADQSTPNIPLTPEDARRQTFERATELLAAKSRSVAELRDLLLERKAATTANV